MTATDDADRRLARGVAVGLPLTGFASTVVTGLAVGFGPAILVLASTALLSTIALLWASLRTLSGDAPLPTALEGSPGARRRAVRAEAAGPARAEGPRSGTSPREDRGGRLHRAGCALSRGGQV